MDDLNLPVPVFAKAASRNQCQINQKHVTVLMQSDKVIEAWTSVCAGMANYLENVAGSAERPAVSQP